MQRLTMPASGPEPDVYIQREQGMISPWTLSAAAHIELKVAARHLHVCARLRQRFSRVAGFKLKQESSVLPE